MLCEILEAIPTRKGVLQPGMRADIPREIFLKLSGKVRRVEQQHEARNFTELKCGTCLYFGWKGLQWFCRHPECKNLIAEIYCDGQNYIDRYAKNNPTRKCDRPEPVPLENLTLAGHRNSTMH